MVAALVVAGVAVEGVAWRLVVAGRRDVWTVTVAALVGLGVVALVAGTRWSPDVDPWIALGVGAASGLALYAGTAGFVAIARPWRAFRSHSLRMYLRQGERSLAAALALSVALAVPGEELFWRGLVQPELASALDGRDGLAALVGWVAYVAANLPSANLAIVAGAVVGGATWAGLAWWSGGGLASLASHGVWTALMLALPVVRADDDA
jgi:membrane protease YdiL (CAAX protease family)